MDSHKPYRSVINNGIGHIENHASGSGGFTLIEIFVTLAVLSVLLAVAAPSLANLLRTNRTTAVAQRFSLDLEFARSEARRRGSSVSLCSSEDGASCRSSDGQDWSKGWIVFVDSNANGKLDSGEAVLRSQAALFSGDSFQSSDGRSALMWGRTGHIAQLSANVTFTLKTAPSDANAQRCITINTSGREKIFKAGDSACP